MGAARRFSPPVGLRLCFVVLALIFAPSLAISPSSAIDGLETTEKVSVCYYGTWATYRPPRGTFDPENVDPTLCTHLVYAFVGITREGDVRVIDGWFDLPAPSGKDGFRRFLDLKKKNPRARYLLGLGGWNEGSETFSYVANNKFLRATFAKNAANFVSQRGFDGLDLDWEYPAARGGRASDKQAFLQRLGRELCKELSRKEAFVELLKELRTELSRRGLLLTLAVGGARAVVEAGYDVPRVLELVDLASVLAYDLHGSWEATTGINAPLFAGPGDTDRTLNVNASIHEWLSRGADPRKLALGVPLYGRTFTLIDAARHGVGAPARGQGEAGPYTREGGFLGYNEICEMQDRGFFPEVWESTQKVPYAYNGDQWIGYENQRSLALKAKLAMDLNLAGIMIWSVETDDFLGLCKSSSGPNPLLRAIRRTLDGVVPEPEPEPEPEPSRPTNPPTDATPTSSTPTPSAPTCPRVGYVRDPKDCAVFYYCYKEGTLLADSPRLECSAGLHFSEDLQVCAWPYQVKCP